jgi:hypothetical protein
MIKHGQVVGMGGAVSHRAHGAKPLLIAHLKTFVDTARQVIEKGQASPVDSVFVYACAIP